MESAYLGDTRASSTDGVWTFTPNFPLEEGNVVIKVFAQTINSSSVVSTPVKFKLYANAYRKSNTYTTFFS